MTQFGASMLLSVSIQLAQQKRVSLIQHMLVVCRSIKRRVLPTIKERLISNTHLAPNCSSAEANPLIPAPFCLMVHLRGQIKIRLKFTMC